MAATQPIRDKEELQKFIAYYKEEKKIPRNYALVVFGLYTALRISDILHLQWKDVYDFEREEFVQHLKIKEQKTGKLNQIPFHVMLKDALICFKQERNPKEEDYIFTKNTSYTAPLHRASAYRIITKAAEKTLKEKNISCHSLRKTFGYHAWKQGTPPALLMDIYNHSSYHVTKKYLGIGQDEKDAIYLKLKL